MNYLGKILSEYCEQFVRPSVIDRIKQREVDGGFPFSVHNMMRAFVNMSPYFFVEFYNLYKREKLEEKGIKKVLDDFGTVTRVYRYFLFLLIGGFLDNTISREEKISFLNFVAEILCYKLDYEIDISEGEMDELKRVLKSKSGVVNKKLISEFSIYLKEYVDYIFLGEHPLAYTTYPPIKAGENLVVVKKYYNIDYRDIYTDVNEVKVIDVYDAKEAEKISLDVFRGNLYGLPNFSKKRKSYVLINNKIVESGDELKRVMNKLKGGFKVCSEYYGQKDSFELESEQSLIYCHELMSMLGKQDFELKEEMIYSVNSNKIAKNVLTENGFKTYTEVYFYLLKQAIENFNNKI